MGEWGIPANTPAGRQQLARAVEARRLSDQAQTVEDLPPCDWCIGSKQFHRELLEQMTSVPEHPYAGKEWQQTAQQKARRILAGELRRRGWRDAELDRRHKADVEKLKIARRLRTETTMTLSWIAQGLKMGAAGSLANCLRAQAREGDKEGKIVPIPKSAAA
ncbi:MAG TPA: hypothetical protein VG167_16210 [Verrucomicrobiae bacterium]|nr:hypothetical protein [Verrucomicrobiae bacterium]